jgi:hypothetical protein
MILYREAVDRLGQEIAAAEKISLEAALGKVAIALGELISRAKAKKNASLGITRPESITLEESTSVQPSPGARMAQARGPVAIAGRHFQLTNVRGCIWAKDVCGP